MLEPLHSQDSLARGLQLIVMFFFAIVAPIAVLNPSLHPTFLLFCAWF